MTGDNDAHQIVRTAQTGRRLFYIAGQDGVAHQSAADDVPVAGEGVHHLHGEAQMLPPSDEKGLVALLSPAKGIIVADKDLPDPQFVPEEIADEFLGRGPRKFRGKGDDEQPVHPLGGDELDLLLQGGNQIKGAAFGVQDHFRVGIESNDYRPGAGVAGLPDQILKQVLVSAVNAVEVADGYKRAF